MSELLFESGDLVKLKNGRVGTIEGFRQNSEGVFCYVKLEETTVLESQLDLVLVGPEDEVYLTE